MRLCLGGTFCDHDAAGPDYCETGRFIGNAEETGVSILGLRGRALKSFAIAIMLTGCGGSQTPISASGALPRGSGIAAHSDRGKSWMLPAAKSDDLLYASDDGNNVVDVYSYPKGTLVAQLDGFSSPSGLCVDETGNVFATDFDGADIVEYAHGGRSPIATFDSNSYPTGCSVDPTTGTLP